MATKKNNTEDYLSKFVADQTSHMNTGEDLISEVQEISNTKNNTSTLGYLSVDLNAIPLGNFYKTGTQIKIRAATVAEVQAYSVVDDSNMIDVTEKMNQILSNCVKVIHTNGSVGSYRDIKDGDRIVLIFMVRELTFQQGTNLAKDVKCQCGNPFKIYYRATPNSQYQRSFKFYKMNPKLEKYWQKDTKTFKFDIDGASYHLAPPCIGIQESFFTEIKKNVASEMTPNVSFMKISPYLLWDRVSITEDGIKKKEDEFKNLNMKTFQILNKAVDLMKFGIEHLYSICPKCATEVHTSMSFPGGASGIFIVPDPFTDFN